MTDSTAAPADPGKASLWEDFIDIFHQPSAVFDRRREGQFGLALLVLIALSAILFFALQNGIGPIVDAEMAKQAASLAAKNPSMTTEQIAQSTSMMEKFAVFGIVIFIPIGIVITAVLLWLIGRLIEAKTAFAAAMMIATYAQFPRIGETVINAVQGLLLAPESITSRYSVSIGPGRFLDSETNPILLTLVGGLDLFTIWVTVLLAIGLSVVARVPLKKAAVAAAAIWLLTLLPALYGAL